MKRPAIPPDEESRLAALESLGILDTAPEERFDRVTRIARRLFEVPVALVSLVDANRQWFKSRQGLETTETPRAVSFCGHAILNNELFIVPDASADPRFADNPLVVAEPHVRFYAGHPLMGPDGNMVGTLCVIDRVPRQFSDEDRQALQDLAHIVERELSAVELAMEDELTGIYNRRGFMALAGQALSQCRRDHRSASLLVMDLDGFKQVNDNLGHAEGDAVLEAFASQMSHSLRHSDVIARIGGDEFVALLTGDEREGVDAVVKRFSDSLDRAWRESGRDYPISFSYGAVEFDPEQHPDIEELLEEGDRLMYQRKQAKKPSR